MSRVLGDDFTELTQAKRDGWWWADHKEPFSLTLRMSVSRKRMTRSDQIGKDHSGFCIETRLQDGNGWNQESG